MFLLLPNTAKEHCCFAMFWLQHHIKTLHAVFSVQLVSHMYIQLHLLLCHLDPFRLFFNSKCSGQGFAPLSHCLDWTHPCNKKSTGCLLPFFWCLQKILSCWNAVNMFKVTDHVPLKHFITGRVLVHMAFIQCSVCIVLCFLNFCFFKVKICPPCKLPIKDIGIVISALGVSPVCSLCKKGKSIFLPSLSRKPNLGSCVLCLCFPSLSVYPFLSFHFFLLHFLYFILTSITFPPVRCSYSLCNGLATGLLCFIIEGTFICGLVLT